MNRARALPVLSTFGRPHSTTPTGRSRSNLSSSASIRRLCVGSVCSNDVFPCRLPLKKIKPSPWQKFFDVGRDRCSREDRRFVLQGEKRQVSSRQGLTLKKNNQSIDAIINEELFSITDDRSSSDDQSHLPVALQSHLDHLYEQIDDLSLQLAEERLNHRQTRLAGEERLSGELSKATKGFEEMFNRRMFDHQKEVEEEKEKCRRSLADERTASLQREEHLKSELEFVKNSFHSYKIHLDEENTLNVQVKGKELSETLRKEFEEKEEETKKKLNETIVKERKNLFVRHKMEMDNLRKQHEKEVDTIHKNFANTAFDRARVETLSKELTATQLERDECKDRAVNLALRLKDLEIRHIETTRELNEFRTRFEEKTKEIEKLYAARLDQLHLHNADLRNLYMKKCAELVDERTITKKKIDERAKMTRKQLQRKLLDVRIASAVPLTTDNGARRLNTCATASQHLLSSTRCRSAFASSHPVSGVDDQSSMVNGSPTDFTMHNTRREMKLRRRASMPITEEEQDVLRYLTTASSTNPRHPPSSKYNFENETTMIGNLTLEDLQQTFKST